MEPKHISCYGCKNDLGGGFCHINLERTGASAAQRLRQRRTGIRRIRAGWSQPLRGCDCYKMECSADEFEAYEEGGDIAKSADKCEDEAKREQHIMLRDTRLALIVWTLLTLGALAGVFFKCGWLAALFSVYSWVCGWSIRGFIEEINRTHRIPAKRVSGSERASFRCQRSAGRNLERAATAMNAPETLLRRGSGSAALESGGFARAGRNPEGAATAMNTAEAKHTRLLKRR